MVDPFWINLRNANSNQGEIPLSPNSLWVTGQGLYGQIGDGSAAPRHYFDVLTGFEPFSPVPGFPLESDLTIIDGAGNSAFLISNGVIWGTGRDHSGKLGIGGGIGVHQDAFEPSITANMVSVSGSASSQSVALDSTGLMWGAGATNQLGGVGGGDSFVPMGLVADSVHCASAGVFYILNGSLFATSSSNTSSEFGFGDFLPHPTFQPVPGMVGVKSVQSIGGVSFAIMLNGDLYADGFSWHNDGNNQTPGFTFTGLTNVTAVDSSDDFGMAISNGTLYAWGTNTSGQLGMGDKVNRFGAPSFTNTGHTGVTQVACGDQHTMMVKNGQLYAAGSNFHGQLGLGALPESISFVTTTDTFLNVIDNVAQISCGLNTSYVLRSSY